MNLGLSLVAVPAIFECNDPLPVWRIIYKRVSKIAVATLLTSSVTGITCFVKNGMGMENTGFLAAGILSFSVIPYTIVLMKPINDHLFSLNVNEEARKVKDIVKTWERYHWLRTITGIMVFGIAVFKIGQS